MIIRAIAGDITVQNDVDAIVNAANTTLLGGGGVDGAIHRAAGPSLLQECRTLGGCPTGSAKITAAYNLPCRYVIHTVGPIISDGIPTKEQERQLANCYRNCLGMAEANGCRSIAFCCISTGEFHFPNRRAAEIAVEACKDATIKVVFNVFKDIDYDIYRELLGKG